MTEFQKRFHELDKLRGLAILGVLGVHVFGNYPYMPETNIFHHLFKLGELMSRYAVPLFLFVSGYALFYKYEAGAMDVLSFYKKRLWRLVLPYLGYSMIYMVLYDVVKGDTITLGSVIDKLIRFRAAEHMWFFRLIAQLYLVFPLLLWAQKRYGRGLLVFAVVTQLMACYLWPSNGYIQFAKWWVYLILGMGYCQGGWFYSDFKHKPSWTAMVLMAWLAWLTATPIMAPVVELLLFTSLIRMCVHTVEDTEGVDCGVLQNLGRHSFGIYLFHLMPLAVAVRAFARVGLERSDILFFPAAFAFTLVVSWFVIGLYDAAKEGCAKLAVQYER